MPGNTIIYAYMRHQGYMRAAHLCQRTCLQVSALYKYRICEYIFIAFRVVECWSSNAGRKMLHIKYKIYINGYIYTPHHHHMCVCCLYICDLHASCSQVTCFHLFMNVQATRDDGIKTIRGCEEPACVRFDLSVVVCIPQSVC